MLRNVVSMHRNVSSDVLKIVIRNIVPFVFYDGGPLNDVPGGNGYELLLIEALSQVLKFRMEFTTAKDGQIGMMLSNGTWVGVVGMLQRKEGDVGLAGLMINENRASVNDFSFPYGYANLGIATRMHSQSSLKPNIFLRAYSIQIWMLIIFSGIFSAFILKLLCVYAEHTGGHSRRSYKPLFYIYSIMVFRVSNEDVPTNSGTRVFILSWSLAAMIIVYAFSGLLISSATVSAQFECLDDLDTLARLVDKGVYNVTLVKSTMQHDIIMRSSSKSMKIIASHLTRNPGWLSMTHIEAYNLVLQEDAQFAYIEVKELAQFVGFLSNKPELYYSQETLGLVYNAMAFQKNSIHRNAFNLWILRFFETGLITKWKDMAMDFLKQKNRLSLLNNVEEIPSGNTYLNMADLHIVLRIFLCGQLAAILVLICEYLMPKFTQLRFKFMDSVNMQLYSQ